MRAQSAWPSGSTRAMRARPSRSSRTPGSGGRSGDRPSSGRISATLQFDQTRDAVCAVRQVQHDGAEFRVRTAAANRERGVPFAVEVQIGNQRVARAGTLDVAL